MDFLDHDVTMCKGYQFQMGGILDTKPFVKPANSASHLPATSHHPPHTFYSILQGTYNRSLLASSSLLVHAAHMEKCTREHLARGYNPTMVYSTLWQGKTSSTEHDKERKRKVVKPYVLNKQHTDTVVRNH